MMEFFYKMELNPEAATHTGATANAMEKFIDLIALSTLVDKYDVKMVKLASADAYKSAALKFNLIFPIAGAEVKRLVHAYHVFCTTSYSAMGEVLAFLLYKCGLNVIQQPQFQALVIQYGNLGGDLFVYGRRNARLTLK
jgi:hypothetical protein